MLYKQWLNEWLDKSIQPIKKLRTYQKYCDIAQQFLIPELGEYEIEYLSVTVLQNFISDLVDKYSTNTVNGIITVLKISLQQAERTGAAQRQCAVTVQYPKYENKKIRCFSPEEQRIIEQYIIRTRNYKLYGILLCLYTGLRVGELLALQWNDIDLCNGFVCVSKTCHDSWEQGRYIKIIDTPKTRSSERIIPIPDTLIPYLMEMKEYGLGQFVICGPNGEDISIRSYQRSFELLLNRINIPHKGFHSVRHTFATRAIECGMDVKTLSEILGHKNPAVTLKIYVHSLMDYKSAMINKLGRNLL